MRVAAVLLLLSSAIAFADDTERDPVALQLFDEGRQLIASGATDQACAKFEAARARVGWLGIKLNLADCYERIGKTATAWALFRKAADQAERAADPRAAFARERAAALEPKLSRISIDRADPATEIRLDGRLLDAAELGAPLPVDPGDHVVDASAPGHQPLHRTITASGDLQIDIPVLETIALPAPVVAPIAIAHRSRLPFVLGAAGAAAALGAVGLGIDAKLRVDRAHDGHCNRALECDREGYDLLRGARLRGDVATVLGAAGVLSIGAAIVIHVRHREITPLSGGVGLAVRGSL